jgi:hypothetical protein
LRIDAPVAADLVGPDATAAEVVGVTRGQVQLHAAAVVVSEQRDDRLAEYLPNVKLTGQWSASVRVTGHVNGSVADERGHAANRDLICGVQKAAENPELLKLAGIASVAERVLVDILVAPGNAAADRDRPLRPILTDVCLQSQIEYILPQILVMMYAGTRHVVDDFLRKVGRERVHGDALAVTLRVCVGQHSLHIDLGDERFLRGSQPAEGGNIRAARDSSRGRIDGRI